MEMKNYSNAKNIFIVTYAVILLCCFCGPALCQPKTITVVFESGEEIETSNWSFVYHLSNKNEVLARGSSPKIIKKKSQNLYLMERYDKKEGKSGFGKLKEINIELEKLSSIEYVWDWGLGNTEKVIITLKDGTKIERLRLGPISTTVIAGRQSLRGEGIYLEGVYKLDEERKNLRYNLNKWLKGEASKKEIITKIVFQ